MAPFVSSPRTTTPGRPATPAQRPSGVMPAFRGRVSLPARVDLKDDAHWDAALAKARQRALVEDEERAWASALERAKAREAEQEQREWAALRARAAAEEEREWAALRARALGKPRVVSWP